MCSKVRGPHQVMPKACFRPWEPGVYRKTIVLVFVILRGLIRLVFAFCMWPKKLRRMRVAWHRRNVAIACACGPAKSGATVHKQLRKNARLTKSKRRMARGRRVILLLAASEVPRKRRTRAYLASLPTVAIFKEVRVLRRRSDHHRKRCRSARGRVPPEEAANSLLSNVGSQPMGT